MHNCIMLDASWGVAVQSAKTKGEGHVKGPIFCCQTTSTIKAESFSFAFINLASGPGLTYSRGLDPINNLQRDTFLHAG